jgi:hypothetical protein
MEAAFQVYSFENELSAVSYQLSAKPILSLLTADG